MPFIRVFLLLFFSIYFHDKFSISNTTSTLLLKNNLKVLPFTFESIQALINLFRKKATKKNQQFLRKNVVRRMESTHDIFVIEASCAA